MTCKYQISFALSCYILLNLSLLCVKIYSYEFYSYFFVLFHSYLFVCIRVYPYVSRTRMLIVCQSYVSVCTRMLLVCYSYVIRTYSCGVLVMVAYLSE